MIMKLSKKIAAGFVLALLGSGLAGCQTHTTIMPLASGYEEVSHPYHTLIDEPPPPRISLQHRSADGTVTPIWPQLYGVSDVLRDDLAIFVGDKGYTEPERVTHPRLFAVRSPELPLDITDEVLWRWAKANGKDFNKALARLTLVAPAQKDGGLEVSLEFAPSDQWVSARDDWPDQSTLQLNWQQVDQIMHAVKTKGVEEKDLQWHTPYIGEKF
jgi:hypothetical protein